MLHSEIALQEAQEAARRRLDAKGDRLLDGASVTLDTLRFALDLNEGQRVSARHLDPRLTGIT